MCLSGLGIHWAFYESYGCELALTIPVQITVVFQWCILLSVLIVVLVFFDPLGSSQAGVHDDSSEVHMHKTTKVCTSYDDDSSSRSDGHYDDNCDYCGGGVYKHC